MFKLSVTSSSNATMSIVVGEHKQCKQINKFAWWLSLCLSLLPAHVITYEDLKALLAKSQNLLLVDVRSKEEVDRGQISGSTHIPGGTISNKLKKKVKRNIHSWWIWIMSEPCVPAQLLQSLNFKG